MIHDPFFTSIVNTTIMCICMYRGWGHGELQSDGLLLHKMFNSSKYMSHNL